MKYILFVVITLVLLTFGFTIYAQSPTIKGLDEAATEANLVAVDGPEVTTSAQELVQTKIGSYIKTVMSLIGFLFFVLVLYGGLIWMTAGGEKARVQKGRSLIIYAVLGLMMIALSYTVVDYIIFTIGTQTMN